MLQMCSFDGSKSTKGASKLRRDLINAEIANLRDLLPLPSSTRQRLSQLQLMALVCVYVRKSNYFQQVFRKLESNELSIPNFGFSKALSGFLIMMTQNGKLLYISDNAAEYLGHSMEDLLIHGDSVYDIIDKADHAAVQSELLRGSPAHAPWEERMFLCRMNVSRNARRQMRFGDQKVVLIRGHFLSFLPLCSRNEPVFLATCSPVAMPETRECVVQGTTAIFTSLHSMDMKFIHIDTNGEYHLGTSGESIQGSSWYQFLHCDNLKEAQHKHRMITQAEADRACILLVRMQSHLSSINRWLWVHVVLQVKDNMEGVQHPVIVCTNQVLSLQMLLRPRYFNEGLYFKIFEMLLIGVVAHSQTMILRVNIEREAEVMRGNSWLYHYYAVHNKLNYMDSPRDGSSSDTPHPPPPPPPIIPQAPPPALHQSLLLPVPYPLDVHSLPNYRHPNGSHHHHQRTSSAPTYTRLDNCWPTLHLSGEEGGALVTHVVHARHALNVNRKCVYSEYAEEEEAEEEAFSPLQHVPDILHNAFNNNKYSSSSSTSGAQHVPQCESIVLDRWHVAQLPLAAADERQRCCLCNINTCLALCTCCRQHSAWSFCCTSGAMACSDEEDEEEEARKKAEKKQKRNSEKA